MVLEDGPLRSAFERDTKGIVKQEFITYVIKGNQLVKETVVRKFSPGGDYTDSTYFEPLVEVKDEVK
tara:strand:- start:73 stop:273 length:201 start_codon:yes stop_codon:yes gene_type:complete